jgi:phosphatidylglycerophosphatase A
MMVFRPSPALAFSHPAHVIAFGFGIGLAPVAPGTVATLAAWPLGRLLGALDAAPVLGALAFLFVLGLWACDLTERRLGMQDHGSMVWDEIVAFLLVLALVPRELAWQAAAFVVFRLFDIVKPPPIRWFERRYHGGFGVMFDDVIAAGYTVFVLALVKRLALWPS